MSFTGEPTISVPATGDEPEFDANCIFCNIIRERTTEFFYEDDDFIAFKDIYPAARHHYLVIPKKHIQGANSLSHRELGLLKKMLSIGEEVLKEQNADTTDAKYGYHWPPFISVKHLHMHAVSPVSEMSIFNMFKFMQRSLWFVSAPKLIARFEEQMVDRGLS